MNRSMHDEIAVSQSIVPAVYSATENGTGVDLRDYDSAEVVFDFGAVAGAGDFTPVVEESDSLATGYTAVAAADLNGTLTATALQNTVERVGYRGAKRYIRATLTKNGGTSIAAGVTVVAGRAAGQPTPNPA